jgi:hypothetical protein
MNNRKMMVGDVVYRPSDKKLRSFNDATDSLLMIVGETDSYPFKTERIRRYLLKNGYAFVVMSLGEDCGEAILFSEDYVKSFDIRLYRGKEYREIALAARRKLLDVLANSNVRRLLGGLAPKEPTSMPEKLPDFRVGDFVILGNFHECFFIVTRNCSAGFAVVASFNVASGEPFREYRVKKRFFSVLPPDRRLAGLSQEGILDLLIKKGFFEKKNGRVSFIERDGKRIPEFGLPEDDFPFSAID